MGHKIKYGAKFFLKMKYFPYLPTHFLGGHVTGNQHIIYFGLTGCMEKSCGPVITGRMIFNFLRLHVNHMKLTFNLQETAEQ